MTYSIAQVVQNYFGDLVTDIESTVIETAAEKVTWGYSLAFELYWVRFKDSEFKTYMPIEQLAKYLIQVGWSIEHYQKIKI